MRLILAVLILLACPSSLHEIAIGDAWEPHEASLGGSFIAVDLSVLAIMWWKDRQKKQ
jgi:hypothetical protein